MTKRLLCLLCIASVIIGIFPMSYVSAADNDTLTLIRFNTDESIAKPYGDPLLTKDSTNTCLYDFSANWTLTIANAQAVTYAFDSPIDMRGYTHFNALVYSEQERETEFNFTLQFNGSNITGSERDRFPIMVDWTGWKVISIPIADRIKHSRSDLSNVYAIRFHSKLGALFPELGTSLSFEKIWLSKDAESGVFNITDKGNLSNLTNAPVYRPQTEITFSRELPNSSKNLSAVKVFKTDEGENSSNVPCDIIFDGNKMRLNFTGQLDFETDYTIRIDKTFISDYAHKLEETVDINFRTAAEGLEVTAPIIYQGANVITDLPSSGEITAKANIVNFSNEKKDVTMVVAVYGEDNRMLEYVGETVEADVEQQRSIEVSLSREDYSGCIVRAFICDNIEAGNLLSDSFAEIKAEDAILPNLEGDGKAISSAFELQTPVVNINDVTIEGGGLWEKGKVMLVTVKNPAGDYHLILPFKYSENGFAYTYTMDDENDSDGIYRVNVSAAGLSVPAVQFQYLNADGQQGFLQLANTGAFNEVHASIVQNYNALGLESGKDSDYVFVANALLDCRPFTSFAEVVEVLYESPKLLEELNGVLWAGLAEFLSSNERIVINGWAGYNKYKDLAEKSQNLVSRDIVEEQPFEGFKDFRETLTEITEDFIAEQGKSNTNGVQNTGGGRGGKTSQVIVSSDNMEAITPPIEETTDSNAVFKDLDGVPWAVESILALYNKGVISLSQDGNFRPDDFITREEYIKMLILCLDIEMDESEVSSFHDIDETQWYAPYIASAERLGITNGDADGYFGIGVPVTREDMCVFVIRALKAACKDYSDVQLSDGTFEDKHDISEYAAGAVASAYESKIILGVGGGMFEPKRNAARSEAAVMFARLIGLNIQ